MKIYRTLSVLNLNILINPNNDIGLIFFQTFFKFIPTIKHIVSLLIYTISDVAQDSRIHVKCYQFTFFTGVYGRVSIHNWILMMAKKAYKHNNAENLREGSVYFTTTLITSNIYMFITEITQNYAYNYNGSIWRPTTVLSTLIFRFKYKCFLKT